MWGALAFRFTILTAARTGEVIGGCWSEINMSTAVWSIPAGRMKSGGEHRVPLSDAAMAVLQKAAGLRAYRRRGTRRSSRGRKSTRGLSKMVMLALLQRMQRSDLTVHGFRSTFRDWAAETTTYQRGVVEAALAHAVGDKTEAAYRRGDLFEKRRRLMEDWAAYCGRVEPAATARVVRIGSAA